MIDTLYEYVVEILGTPPVGKEYLAYTAAVIILCLFTVVLFKIFTSVFNALLGK